MKAIEFQATACDGVIKLPTQFRDWEGKPVRVILLQEEQQENIATIGEESAKFKALRLSTRGFRFNREEANER